jgi:rhomboid protease GluP
VDERAEGIIADAVALDDAERAKRSAEVEVEAQRYVDPKAAFADFQFQLREITPRVRVLPAIFALNVLVFAAMVASGLSAMNPTAAGALKWGANFGPRTLNGEAWRLVANFFVHFGVIHLAANMFALWNAGALVERLFGSLAFTALYFVAGITGSLASLVVHPTVVSAGASGAIFGVYGALAAVVLLHRGAIPKVVISRLGGAAGTFIAYNLVYGAANAGIDNAAHLGGLIGGFAAGAFLARPLVLDRPSSAKRAVMAALGAVVLAGVVVMVMPRPLDFQAVVNDFATSEQTVLGAYKVVAESYDAGKIDGPQMAAQMEQTMLPPWHAAHVKLETQSSAWLHHSRATPSQKRLLELLLRDAEVRETDWIRMIVALKAGDRQAADAIAQGTYATVQGLLTELNGLKP